MYSFRIRHVTYLLLAVTQQCIFGCVADETYERKIPAQVATRFLKASWINLNLSLTDEVTSHCRNDLTTFLDKADAGEIWALQMLDAASKIPSGILTGHIVDFGMYDECIRVKAHENPATIQGQHCLVSFAVPSKFISNAAAVLKIQKIAVYNPTADADPSLTLSVCLPSSCGIQDVVAFANGSIQRTPEFLEFGVNVAQVKCFSAESLGDLATGTILTIFIFIAIVSGLLFCTACEFVMRSRSEIKSSTLKTLAKFSLYTNAIKLLSTERTPGAMPAINGIRCLSTFSIIILHKMLITMMNPVVNLTDIYELRESNRTSLILMFPYVVDTFFLISAFLATHSYLKRLQTGGKKWNLLEFYLHRFIRLTPSICAMLLVVIFVIPHFGSGPIWEMFIGSQLDNCQKNWWANLLFIQNFASREDMCLPHTWYSAVEMQFFVLSPIILYPLFHRPRLGLSMLGLLSIAALITPAIQILINNYSFFFNDTINRYQSRIDFFNSYTMTYNRALPYLIGILLGYDAVNTKRRLMKVGVVFNWILACIFILFCIWNTQFTQFYSSVYHAASEAIQVSLGRLAWSLTVGWILYACTHGYGGPLTRFLSLPLFIPLSRMSYNIYLIHVVLQVFVVALKRTSDFYTVLAAVYPVWSDMAMSIVLAFVLNLCIETPALILEKIVRAKGTTPIGHRASPRKKEELTAKKGIYLDLIEDQISSDSVIEMRMRQTDFWTTMSDALNVLNKGTSKTPGEWANKWWEWRKDNQPGTRASNIRNGAAQIETRVPILKEELSMFLVAVSCGLDDAGSIEESKIVGPAAYSQLTSDSTSSTKKDD